MTATSTTNPGQLMARLQHFADALKIAQQRKGNRIARTTVPVNLDAAELELLMTALEQLT